MISCLICASSILLISSIFTSLDDGNASELDSHALIDDAETCLKVFEALGPNSSAARIAREMMTRLKDCGIEWSKSEQKIRLASNTLLILG